MSTRRRVYGSLHTGNATIRLKARNMSAHKYPQIQDPGYVRYSGLFLGLFDVTRDSSVAVGTLRLLFGTVWHCFDTVSVLY